MASVPMSHLITDLGDSALLVPASALLLAYLVYLRATRRAVIWVSTLALCAGVTIILKIGFYACGAEVPLLDMRSPSGHASFSTTFYTCFALMITAGKDRWTRLSLLLASTALVAAIAASRVVLHAHTVPEVVAGLAIGALCVGWFAARYFAYPVRALAWQPLLGAVLVLALVTHGLHLDLEGMITQVARLLRAGIPACA